MSDNETLFRLTQAGFRSSEFSSYRCLKCRRMQPAGVMVTVPRAMNLPRMVRCDHCSMPYYQTSAPHVCVGWTTKENRAVNESEKFITTGVFSHERNTSGNCSVSGCPCRGWSAQESVNEQEHEPVARGGKSGQSGLFPRYSFAIVTGRYKILDNRSDGPVRITQIATADGESEARTVIQALNQHHSLLAEREKLRTAAQAALDNLYERSLTRKHWSTYDQKVYEQLDAALNDQKGE